MLRTFLIIIGFICIFDTHAKTMQLNPYGSLRIGLDNIHADIANDELYWRDYLSRVGIKPSLLIDSNFTLVGHLEYGLRGQKLDSLKDDLNEKKRLSFIGIESKKAGIYFGRQNVLWHQFVRTNYFLGGLDTERQGVLSDDNLLQFFQHGQNWRMGIAMRMDEKSFLGARNIQFGGQTQINNIKVQTAFIRDTFGPSKGTLFGFKLWYFINENWTFSVYSHNATSNFDEYAGGSSGLITISQADPALRLKAIQTCVSEKRKSFGGYLGYNWQKHKVHARLASDECGESGDVGSSRVEYIYSLSQAVKMWLSLEHLDYEDARRSPLFDLDSVYHSQLGLRYDF